MLYKLWPRSIQALIVLALPICLAAADMRIATGHWFVRWEYGKAGFPPDEYGFSTEERTRLAEVCVDYLATGADTSLLADLQLSDGSPAFNARELSHMRDVQTVYRQIITAGIVAALALVAGLAVLGVSRRNRCWAPSALQGGSVFTLGLLAAIGAYMALSWGEFFDTFHSIFFEGDSWLFAYSDTLIRLFPMRFWLDVAVVIVGLLVVEVIGIGVMGWVWARRTDSTV